MKTLVIGASGGIGSRLVRRLVGNGQPVRAMVRDETRRTALENAGAEVVIGDLEGGFRHALEGCDAVVFSAGSGARTGADKTMLIDLWGAVKTIDACRELGIARCVMISSRRAGDPDAGPAKMRHYLVAKHLADRHLLASGLEYTILRPGRLTDDPGTGLVRTSRPPEPEQVIPRDDVAEAVRVCLDSTATVGHVYELYQGDTPIPRALGAG